MTVTARIEPIPQPQQQVVLTMPLDVAVTLKSLCVEGVQWTAIGYGQQMESVWDALEISGVACNTRFKGKTLKEVK